MFEIDYCVQLFRNKCDHQPSTIGRRAFLDIAFRLVGSFVSFCTLQISRAAYLRDSGELFDS